MRDGGKREKRGKARRREMKRAKRGRERKRER